jgi:hypothetical protein
LRSTTLSAGCNALHCSALHCCCGHSAAFGRGGPRLHNARCVALAFSLAVVSFRTWRVLSIAQCSKQMDAVWRQVAGAVRARALAVHIYVLRSSPPVHPCTSNTSHLCFSDRVASKSVARSSKLLRLSKFFRLVRRCDWLH